jgi:hypothetical protein
VPGVKVRKVLRKLGGRSGCSKAKACVTQKIAASEPRHRGSKMRKQDRLKISYYYTCARVC